eukprot:6181856-Pleurochrysis_carterae.AAC.2
MRAQLAVHNLCCAGRARETDVRGQVVRARDRRQALQRVDASLRHAPHLALNDLSLLLDAHAYGAAKGLQPRQTASTA